MPHRVRDPVGNRKHSVSGQLAPTVNGTDYDSGMAIGEKIKQRREELRLSIKQLATAAGMGPTTLYDLERGDQQTSTRLHALCKVLGLNPEWVADGRGPRLVQNFQNPVFSDPPVTAGISDTGMHDMAHMARDVFEVALLLSTLAEPMRSRMIALIHAAVGQQASTDPVDPQDPIPTVRNADTLRK
jgi:transcriptional regulator with XRE-family HTH domain